jgi:hypothetical protein
MSFDASASLSISDPNARALSSSCFDFLLIELVPMAERLAKDLATDDNPEDEEVRESTYFRLESLGYRVGQGLAERCVNTRQHNTTSPAIFLVCFRLSQTPGNLRLPSATFRLF